MRAVLRGAAAVIVGFVVATVVMTVIEMINGRVLYPELGKMAEGVTDREVVRTIMATAPIGAFVVVIAGWALGSLVGAMVAAWIGGGRSAVRYGLLLGILLTVAGIANNLMLPPPLWFWVASLVVLIPAAHLGARIVQSRRADA